MVATALSIVIAVSACGCESRKEEIPLTAGAAESAIRESRESQERTLERLAAHTIDYLGTGRVEMFPGPGRVLKCKAAGGGRGAASYSNAFVYFPEGRDLQGYLAQLGTEYATYEGWETALDSRYQGLWLRLVAPEGSEFHARQNIRYLADGESRFTISSFGACIPVPEEFDMFARL